MCVSVRKMGIVFSVKSVPGRLTLFSCFLSENRQVYFCSGIQRVCVCVCVSVPPQPFCVLPSVSRSFPKGNNYHVCVCVCVCVCFRYLHRLRCERTGERRAQRERSGAVGVCKRGCNMVMFF